MIKTIIVIVLFFIGCEDKEANERIRIEAEKNERIRIEAEKNERIRIEAEKNERIRIEAEKEIRIEAERLLKEKEDTERIRIEAERLLKEKEDAEQSKFEDVSDNPQNYLFPSGYQYYNKGLINSYLELTSVTVQNNSDYRVGQIEGMMNWFDNGGNSLGLSPVTLYGKIEAGETMTFEKNKGSIKSGTIQGKSSRGLLRIDKVKVYK